MHKAISDSYFPPVSRYYPLSKRTVYPTIELVSNFIHSPEQVFAELRQSVKWDERIRARKTASFGVPYNYSQISYPAVAMPTMLDALCKRIETRLGFLPNNCLLNYYLNGFSSMGFHSDENEQLVDGTGVAIISLGCARSIIYRHKRDKTVECTYILESGSLLYMSNELQEEWLHAIPKEVDAGERISLSFRLLKPA